MSLKVLFVCLGNICRSPALESTLRKMVEEVGLSGAVEVDSCGIHSYFLGSKADPMMREAAKKKGVEIDTRAKLWEDAFFKKYDHIFVVDTRLLKMLKLLAKSKKLAQKVALSTAYSENFKDQEIPDPYMGKAEGFERVMEMIVDACQGILKHLETET